MTPDMERYLANAEWGGCDAMKTLMTEKDLNGVTEILANIAMALLLKDKQEVVPEDEQTLLRVKDENAWLTPLLTMHRLYVNITHHSKRRTSVGCMRLAGGSILSIWRAVWTIMLLTVRPGRRTGKVPSLWIEA